MSTVVKRSFASSPVRNSHDSWVAIVDLLTGQSAAEARAELLSVAGIAASLIADETPTSAPIIVTCDGPRTRIYCVYHDDAVEGSDVNESPLGFDPLNGDWVVSLPCQPSDLGWVSDALASKSKRITARGPDEKVESSPASKAQGAALAFDPAGFLGK